MPANLTPQYLKAEEAYRKAQSATEQIECLEEMLRLIPKHKGTDHLQGDIKAKLKEARAELKAEKQAPKTSKSYRIPHQGAGQVILLGAPNAGKSRVLDELTNAKPQVAEYPFTTREPMPGMMPWNDVLVQLVDTPPVTADHMEGYMTGLVRSADAVVLCMDGSSDDAPDETGEVIAQLSQRKTVLACQSGFDEEDFSIVRVKTLLVPTRGDDPGLPDRLEYFREMIPNDFALQPVELTRPDSVEELRDRIYRFLNVIRVYTKAPGKKADLTDPFTLPVGGTVAELATKVHRELAKSLKFARIWGADVHDGQSVGPDHVLSDEDLIELHM